MQTVVNLDPDVDAFLRPEACERNLEFDKVLNDAIRAGFSSRDEGKAHRFVRKTYPLGAQVDLTKASALSGEHAGSTEQVVEEALESLVAEQGGRKKGMTAHEAVDRIRELRKGITLGGISVTELVNEGRKH